MQLFRIITTENGKNTLWAETNNLKVLRDFIQYVLDSCARPEIYILWDVENGKYYNMLATAENIFKMRKRTFEERMKNINTGIFENV